MRIGAPFESAYGPPHVPLRDPACVFGLSTKAGNGSGGKAAINCVKLKAISIYCVSYRECIGKNVNDLNTGHIFRVWAIQIVYRLFFKTIGSARILQHIELED